MKTVSKFNLASLLLAGAVSLGGIGIAKLITNNAKSASADVTSAYAEEDPAIGMGKENKATVTIASDAPVTLTLNNVTAGQYFLVFEVANAGPNVYLDVTAQIGENYAFPTYNSYLKAYTAQVDVAADSQIILTTYAETPITADVYLTELFIGDSTANAIYGLPVSSTAAKSIPVIETTSGTYYARFNTYDTLEANAKFYIQVDDGTPAELVYNENMGGYIAEVTMTSSVKTITISTTNTATISFDLELVAKIEVTTELPEETAKDFTLYEVQRFVYTATETGYFTITPNSTTTNAEFAITLKTNPNYLTGSAIMGDNYPIHMVKDTAYYFEITYTGIRISEDDEDFDPENPPVPPTTVSATFAIDKWTASTIELDKIVYVPVTLASSETTMSVTISGIAGNTYDIALTDVPFYDKAVYMHYGTEMITLSGETGFTGSITLNANQITVYFTTDYTEEFTTGVSLTYTPVPYDDQITLGVAKQITVRAGETLMYFMYNVRGGSYRITLTGSDGNVVVMDAYDNTIIAQGNTSGDFVFTPFEDEETGTQYLIFSNTGATNLTVTATITPIDVEGVIEVGVAKGIVLGAGESKNYTIGLTATYYTITLAYPDGSKIEVYLDGDLRIAAGTASGLLNISETGNHVLTFTNTAETEVTFTVTVAVYS